MLMSNRCNMPFCAGALLQSFGLLPEMNDSTLYISNAADDRTEAQIEAEGLLKRSTYYNIKNCKTNPRLDTKRCASQLVKAFLENGFFCGGKQEMIGYYFDDLRNMLIVDNAKTRDNVIPLSDFRKQYIRNLMIWPSFCKNAGLSDELCAMVTNAPGWENAKIKGFIQSEDEKFWMVSTYCLMELLQEALGLKNKAEDIKKDYQTVIESWTNEIQAAQNAYRMYFDQQLIQPMCERSALEIYTGKSRVPQQVKQQTTDAVSGESTVQLGWETVQDYFGASETLFDERFLATVKVAKSYDITTDFTDPIGMAVKVPYLTIYVAGSAGLCRSSFTINPQMNKQIDITDKGIDFLKENHAALWMDMQMHDITCTGYKPFSYPKVHISALYRDEIMPGDESVCRWKLTIGQIEYYDALICRNYFTGKYTGTELKMRNAFRKFFRREEFTTQGFESTAAFFLMAGEGTWIISSDGYLMISVRGKKLMEKPGAFCYSSAGSLEYTSRLSAKAEPAKLEADPFLTAARELYEETNIIGVGEIESVANKLEMIGFGIDTERFLQQFSFLYRSPLTASRILEYSRANKAKEQLLFAVKFTARNVSAALRNLDLEPGAVASLIALWNCAGKD